MTTYMSKYNFFKNHIGKITFSIEFRIYFFYQISLDFIYLYVPLLVKQYFKLVFSCHPEKNKYNIDLSKSDCTLFPLIVHYSNRTATLCWMNVIFDRRTYLILYNIPEKRQYFLNCVPNSVH